MIPKKRGFTLVELLFVISILGIILIIVLASLYSAREKARVASLLRFSSGIYHSLGHATAGMWSFDEGSTTVTDISGNNRTCTLNDGAYLDNNGATGKALYVSGGSYCGDRDKGITPTNRLTVEAFFYPELSTRGVIATEMDYGPTRGFRVYISNGYVICYMVNNDTGAQVQLSAPFSPGEWNHVACTYDSTRARLYVNEKLASSDTFSGYVGDIRKPGIKIGNNPAASSSDFTGYIDRVAVYSDSFQ